MPDQSSIENLPIKLSRLFFVRLSGGVNGAGWAIRFTPSGRFFISTSASRAFPFSTLQHAKRVMKNMLKNSASGVTGEVFCVETRPTVHVVFPTTVLDKLAST